MSEREPDVQFIYDHTDPCILQVRHQPDVDPEKLAICQQVLSDHMAEKISPEILRLRAAEAAHRSGLRVEALEYGAPVVTYSNEYTPIR